MNDQFPSKAALMDRATPDGGPVGPSSSYSRSNGPVSAAVAASHHHHHHHLSSINRTKVAINKVSANAPINHSSSSSHSSKSVAPLLTKDIPIRERSSSSSPVKSAATKDAVQFCLCQPDPKIPRPRNGEFLRSRLWRFFFVVSSNACSHKRLR